MTTKIQRQSNDESNGNPPFAMKLQRMGHPADEGWSTDYLLMKRLIFI
jgi:hypothetical protein